MLTDQGMMVDDHTSFSTLSDADSAAIDAGHIYRPHGEALLEYARENNKIIGIRELNSLTAQRFEEGIKSSSAENGARVTRSYSVEGKDFHTKFKSSIYGVVAGFIPIDNVLSKKDEPDANAKMQAMLDAEPEKYQAVVLTVTRNGESYEAYYHVNDRKSRDVDIFLKGGDGQFYVEEDGQLRPIPHESLQNGLQQIKVLGNARTGKAFIPDYDLAIVGGQEKSSAFLASDSEIGNFPLDAREMIKTFQGMVDDMIRHSWDSFNPVGYDLEMTKDSPYTMFTPATEAHPKGQVVSITSPQQYIDFLNEWRGKGYNLVPNPKAGIEVDENGKLFLPPTNERFNWKGVDEQVLNIKKAAYTAAMLSDPASIEKLAADNTNGVKALHNAIDHLSVQESVVNSQGYTEYKLNVGETRELKRLAKHCLHNEKFEDLAKLFTKTAIEGIKLQAELADFIAGAEVKLSRSQMNMHEISSPEVTKEQYQGGIENQRETIRQLEDRYQQQFGNVSPAIAEKQRQSDAQEEQKMLKQQEQAKTQAQTMSEAPVLQDIINASPENKKRSAKSAFNENAPESPRKQPRIEKENNSASTNRPSPVPGLDMETLKQARSFANILAQQGVTSGGNEQNRGNVPHSHQRAQSTSMVR